MANAADLAAGVLNGMGSEGHIPAEPGDYIGPENRLHCGVCRECKEYRLPTGRFVPSLCRCGRMARDEAERREREQRMMERVNELANICGRFACWTLSTRKTMPNEKNGRQRLTRRRPCCTMVLEPKNSRIMELRETLPSSCNYPGAFLIYANRSKS